MASSPLTMALLGNGMGGNAGMNLATYDPQTMAAMQRLGFAQNLASQGLDSSSAYPAQALSRLGQALLGGVMLKRGYGDLQQLGQQRQQETLGSLQRMWGNEGGSPGSMPAAPTAPQPSVPQQPNVAPQGAAQPQSSGGTNYASLYGDPTSPDWAKANLTTVSAPSGANFTVNNKAADAFKGFLGDLEAAGYKVNPGESGGYNLRNVTGGTTLSPHAYGAAIDINSSANPYSKTPDGGTLQTNLPPNVGDLAAKWGLEWGGNWKSLKDPMHFEYVGQKPTQYAQAGNIATDASAAPAPGRMPMQGSPQQNPQIGLSSAPGASSIMDRMRLIETEMVSHRFNPTIQEMGKMELQRLNTELQMGRFETVQTPNGPVSHNLFSNEQKPWYTAAPRFTTDAHGNVIAGMPGGTFQSVAPNASGITGSTPEANAARIIAEIGPKVQAGSATPQEQASYNTAAEIFQNPQVHLNPNDQTLNRIPTRAMPVGMPASAGGATLPQGAPQELGGAGGKVAPGQAAAVPQTSDTGVQKLTPGGAPPAAVDKRYDDFHKLETTALGARDELQQAQLLKNTLHDLGSTGPATSFLANLSRYAAQMGVPDETIKKFGLPNGATEAQAAALANSLAMEVARTAFPQRITNTDLRTAQSIKPNPNNPMAANDYLLDNTIIPKAQRDVDRYGHIVNLTNPKHSDYDASLGSLNAKLYEFDQAHPLSSYTPGFQPKPTQQGGAAPAPQAGQQPQQSQEAPPMEGARKAPDGNWYVSDPKRPGKYMMVR